MDVSLNYNLVVVFLVVSDDDILHMSKNLLRLYKPSKCLRVFFCVTSNHRIMNFFENVLNTKIAASQRDQISFLLNFTLYSFHGGKSVGNSRPLSTKSIFDQNVLLSVWKLN